MQGTSKELSSNKHVFAVLQFEHENQTSRSKYNEVDVSRDHSPCRRSQRLRLKELKRTHFLFHAPQIMTPVNRQGEIVLAYETPDQELITLAARRQPKTVKDLR